MAVNGVNPNDKTTQNNQYSYNYCTNVRINTGMETEHRSMILNNQLSIIFINQQNRHKSATLHQIENKYIITKERKKICFKSKIRINSLVN